MEILASKKQLLQKEKSIFRMFSCLSYEEILYAYSYYIELRICTKEEPRTFQSENGVFLAVNEFLKKIHEYRRQEEPSDSKPSLQTVIEWILEAEDVLIHIRTGQYKKGETDSDDRLYKKLVFQQQEAFLRYETLMYVDACNKKNNMGINSELGGIDWACITETMIKDRIDPQLEFITLGRINQEVIPYYYIRDSMIGIWSSFPENELCETLRPIDRSIHEKVKYNFLRISCKLLKAELGKLINLLKLEGFEIGNEPLQTLLTNLDSPDFNKTASSFPFFQIGDYVYTNKRWLYRINFADHIFSDFWMNASKSEQKTFSDKYEQTIANILGNEANGFAARGGVRYKIEETPYDIDIVAIDASTIIFGEIKTTNIKNDYPSIIYNIDNRLNGKASSQLRRLKQHLKDPNALQQIGITKNDMSTKEIVYMIFSMTPDGIGQSDEFLSVNLFLLELMIGEHKNTGVSLSKAYDGLIKDMTSFGLNGLDYPIRVNLN